ncbi:MAG: FAD binding domain-containing protein [Hydrogenophaga sp.]|uniref:xanthine dehydrogenase small subunit n=1 Tax=Hydrogenophaga sp. TaxID=1904254 RepID=UPI001BC14024|nr:FAD binding domain-containing protein [Hydrogenophaga sp.]MBS3911891.1 FAD binding domain-containing protein [Hydrogenophaga sp.]MDO9148607.1 FAD binding domain-containing protein [Hydrogenophaga sp.]MDO9605474.1 FAD binding domain-containing protein [Hydrogenophaga sp.]MDP2165859.1 FAD binding domain-containing protein [Hydrogenophaga sp.]MDP3475234.1 FAD binding domain-containing protein [Hydrogenophaga sp.]
MTSEIVSQPLTFLRRGQPVTLRNVPPDRTLLEVLREDLHLSATKEGCGEGDCGACTVVLGETVDGQLRYRAVNSCIRLAHSVMGMAVFTAEDIGSHTGDLHPAQAAMVRCHASQCGFCTPGFVMSLFGAYQNSGGQGISREQAQTDLSGNLCRCTGYRPILDAAETMGSLPLPAGCAVDEAATLAALKALKPQPKGDGAYLRPTSLATLLQQRAKFPKAQVVAGCTDVGLWVTKLHKRFDRVLDVTAARELRRVESYPHHIAIGAAVSLTDAFAALVHERPQLKIFSQRFAGLPVRNAGTLGGNVANGSPIGDSMPLLIALGASVVLMRWKKTAAGGAVAHRELRLEDLYTGYRTNVMRADELLCWIKVPRPIGHAPGRPRPTSAPSGGSEPNAVEHVRAEQFMRVYKISKRFDDDISAVCLAIQMTLKDGTVQQVSIGAGGVAATPARARQTEAALLGQPWNANTVMAATAALRAEFQPISDMRASARYRQTVLGNLLQRFWLESQGMTAINLENSQTLEALA